MNEGRRCPRLPGAAPEREQALPGRADPGAGGGGHVAPQRPQQDGGCGGDQQPEGIGPAGAEARPVQAEP